MATNSADNQRAEVTEIAVRWPKSLLGMPTLYANHFSISHSGPEFFMTFGVVTPPTGIPRSEDEVGDLEALPVAKIAITPEMMIRIARTIEENVQKYLATRDLREEGLFDQG
jgi:hypothetical protein